MSKNYRRRRPSLDDILLPPTIPKENILKSRFWNFRFVQRKEYMFVSPFNNDKIQILQRITEQKRWARVMTIKPNEYNNYSYEIMGIIEFDYPKSKDWVQQNIRFDAQWAATKTPPNQWVQRFINDAQQGNIIFYDEINDGPHPNE
jgi:hypothetical protein